MANTFMIADTHFGDENIIKFEGRPFKSVKEMNQTMIENWNSVVSDEDTVFVLGDFISDASCLPLVDNLKGHIKLILGNHDTPFVKDLKYKGIEIYEYPIVFNNFWILSHEPMYVSENSPYANIFGHIHNNPMYNTVSCRSFCVCVERNKYMPVRFECIKDNVQMRPIRRHNR